MGVVISYQQKYVFQKKPKDINVKTFNMIINKNEAKTMIKHVSFDSKFKFNDSTYNSNQKWNNETCQLECKKYRKFKKAWILAHVFVRMLNIWKVLLILQWLSVMKLHLLWILYQQKLQIL